MGLGRGQFGERVGEARPSGKPGARYMSLTVAPTRNGRSTTTAAAGSERAGLARSLQGCPPTAPSRPSARGTWRSSHPIALGRTGGQNGNVRPAHLLQPGSGHRRAHAVIIHQHDPPAPGRNVSVGFLHQLAAGSRAGAAQMPGLVFFGGAGIEHVEGALCGVGAPPFERRLVDTGNVAARAPPVPRPRALPTPRGGDLRRSLAWRPAQPRARPGARPSCHPSAT